MFQKIWKLQQIFKKLKFTRLWGGGGSGISAPNEPSFRNQCRRIGENRHLNHQKSLVLCHVTVSEVNECRWEFNDRAPAQNDVCAHARHLWNFLYFMNLAVSLMKWAWFSSSLRSLIAVPRSACFWNLTFHPSIITSADRSRWPFFFWNPKTALWRNPRLRWIHAQNGIAHCKNQNNLFDRHFLKSAWQLVCIPISKNFSFFVMKNLRTLDSNRK